MIASAADVSWLLKCVKTSEPINRPSLTAFSSDTTWLGEIEVIRWPQIGKTIEKGIPTGCCPA